jgi:hypothetical protein
MSDVFISYARTDREFAHRLCEALRSRGIAVWWDFDLYGGEDFRTRIGGVIEAARRVVVLWSAQSVQSHFVIDEAGEAKRLGKLVPLSIDDATPPLGFRGLHTIRVRELEADLDQIVASIEGRPASTAAVRSDQPKPGWLSRRAALGMGAAAAAVAAGGAYRFWPQAPEEAERTLGPVVAPNTGEPDFSKARRTALVIGNADYRQIHKLINPPGDAAAAADALEQRGFRVVLKQNLDRAAMLDAFQTFENTLSIVGGVGLLYYAGNAVHIEGIDLLMPVDVVYDKDTRRIEGTINLTDLLHKIQAQTTKSFEDDGHAILYSASRGQRALDGPPGGHSPFSTAFLETLETADGDLSGVYRALTSTMDANQRALEVSRRLTRGVTPLRATQRAPEDWQQEPYLEDKCRKPFHFNDPAHDAEIGAMKIIILDACRDNPFNAEIAAN